MSFNYLSGQYVPVDGDALIYVEEVGNPQGEPLLLLSGGLGSLHDFDAIVAGLSQQWRLIGMDWRGHGKSTLGNLPLSYARYQSDVLVVLDQLGVTKTNVLGFSDGGIVGYRLAAEQPERIQRLVTIGAQWRLEPDDSSIPFLNGLSRADWQEKFPDEVAQYEELNPQPDFDVLLAAVKQLWLDTSVSGYPAESVRLIAAPTLLVRGDGDFLLPLNELVELQQRVPAAGLLNLPFVGHSAHSEAPTVFLAAIENFLGLPRLRGQAV